MQQQGQLLEQQKYNATARKTIRTAKKNNATASTTNRTAENPLQQQAQLTELQKIYCNSKDN